MRWFLPVLFISYMAGITLFTHSHVVNGVTIVHSHPFKKDSPHSHTTVEFQLIHLLSHVATTGAGIFFLSFQFIAYLLYRLSCNSWGINLCNFPSMHTPLLIYTGRTSYLPLHEMKP